MIAEFAATIRGIVPAIGWTLLNFVWLGALLAAVVATALAMMRRRSAELQLFTPCGA